jgi:hypothetical protein
MKPIEKMAKVIGATDISKPGWNEEAARAALLALAEAELSEEAIREGNDHATNDQSEFEDTEPVARAFRAILRHLAEEAVDEAS